MARTTARVSNRIWTGQTGRALREEPTLLTRTVFDWLISNDIAVVEPYGLYLCQPDVAVAQIGPKLCSMNAVLQALVRLGQLGCIRFDPLSSYVWVVEAAHWQVLDNGVPLSPKDWRAVAAARWYSNCYDNPFLGVFWDRYHRELRLGDRRQGRHEGSPSRGDLSTQEAFDLIGEEGGLGGETPPAPAAKRPTKKELDAEIDRQMWPLFLEWWAIYPVKSGKQDAFKAYREEKPPQEKLLETTRRYLTSREWAERPNGDRAIPYPATFLRGHRWDDDPTPQRQKRGAVGSQEYADRANGWREVCASRGHRPTCQTPIACTVKFTKENRDNATDSENSQPDSA